MRSALILCCGLMLYGQTVQEWIQEGAAAYKAAQYDEAVENFKQAAAADPKSVQARLYLATAYLAIFYSGPQDDDKLRNTLQAFDQVLELDPRNRHAVSTLAALGMRRPEADQARQWQLRLLEIDPNNKEAHFALGVIAWSKFAPAYQAARARAGLKAGDPGPFKDAKLRSAMRGEWEPVLQDGIQHLQRAVELDPRYDDAMTYLNLLIRSRADFADNPYAYQAQMVKAETWVKKALEIKKRKGNAAAAPALSIAAPPLPETP